MCAFAFVAQAQVRKFHYVDGGYWVKIDLNKKEFLPDGCGVDPMPKKTTRRSATRNRLPPMTVATTHICFATAMFTLRNCHVYAS